VPADEKATTMENQQEENTDGSSIVSGMASIQEKAFADCHVEASVLPTRPVREPTRLEQGPSTRDPTAAFPRPR
jgi:hypothetical protein